MSQLFISIASFRACLHGGGGPHVGEVTRLSIKSLFLIWSRLNNMGGVTLHMLPYIFGFPHLHVNRALLNWAVMFLFHTNKWKLSLLQTPLLRTISPASYILYLHITDTSRLCEHLTLSLSYHFESLTPSVTSLPENWVGILVGWLSSRSHYYVYLWAIVARLSFDFPRIERLLGVKKCWQSLS